MISFRRYFLIATPAIRDSCFDQAVIYLYQHDDERGALGFIINKPFQKLTFTDILQESSINVIKPKPIDLPVLLGGPIDQDHVIMLHRKKRRLQPTTSLEIINAKYLNRLSVKNIKTNLNIFLGCAGWHPGQLEKELKMEGWLVAPVSDDLLYDVPIHVRYKVALDSIGVDLAKLSSECGEA